MSWRRTEYRSLERTCSLIISGTLCLALCLPGLLGCTVGPDFQRPRSDVPQNWKGLQDVSSGQPPAAASEGTLQASVATAGQEALVEWWRAFDDPTLTSLVERALRSNLDVLQAQSRIRQARAARGIVAAGLWPGLNATGSYTRNRGTPSTSGSSTGSSFGTGGMSGSKVDGGDVERNLFQAGLDASWELDLFGGTRRNIEASDADIQAALEDRRDVMVSMAAEVGNQYIALRTLQRQLDIARGNLKTQKHTAEITRKRYEAGYVGALDLANARSEVATTESQIPTFESSAQEAIYSLSLLLGLDPAALDRELSCENPIPPIPPQIPVGIPADLLRRRPDIRRAEAQIHAATARIGVATADLFPKISLTGSLGFSSTDLTTLANWNRGTWGFGPGISWPVFDAGRIRANIEVQNALEEQAVLTYQKTVLTALKDVETALVAYAKEQQRRSALMEANANDRKAMDLAMQLYTAGKTDFLNVLNAQRSLYVSSEALAGSDRSLATDLIALFKALGGGWKEGS